MSATRLRSELYQVLDRVLETGQGVEVTREKGSIVIQPARSARTARRKKAVRGNPNLVVGDPDDFVHFQWSKDWKPFL